MWTVEKKEICVNRDQIYEAKKSCQLLFSSIIIHRLTFEDQPKVRQFKMQNFSLRGKIESDPD